MDDLNLEFSAWESQAISGTVKRLNRLKREFNRLFKMRHVHTAFQTLLGVEKVWKNFEKLFFLNMMSTDIVSNLLEGFFSGSFEAAALVIHKTVALNGKFRWKSSNDDSSFA